MKILIFDIETLKEYFLTTFYDPILNEYYEFSLNKNEDHIFQLVSFLREKGEEGYYLVGFNNISFDAQVLEFIIKYYEKWVELTNLEVTHKIAEFAQECISRSNYGLFPPYREEFFNNNHIDLFRIHHFDNENRRTGLKWLEFMMDLDNVEEMPVHWDKSGLTDDEIETVKKYCRNDVYATYRFYLYTTGAVEDEFYKGKNKIQDRLDLIEEYSFPKMAINWSDVRIGDEINLLGYGRVTGLSTNDIYKKKLGRKPTKSFTFKDCIPSYVKFETEKFKDFHKKVSKEKVRLRDKTQSYSIEHNGTTYTIMKGGIHSTEKNRIIVVGENEILEDADVGSQYPNAIVKRKLYPNHLGIGWLNQYNNTIQKRIDYKDRGKSSLKYKGISDMLKLALNGGGFGKTNEINNWQYDPLVTFYCTIGNQFEILMLIEKLEINGIRVVSANTDGIVSLYDKSKEQTYKDICKWWEETVGNDKMGKLEFTRFTKLVQTSVNDYIAIKTDGTVKKKGDFATVYELNKNKSRRIIPLALEAYFTRGIDPETFIKSHTNIFDFCIGVKSSKNYHYQTIDTETYEKEDLFKMVRYIVSNKGKTLIKVKNEGVISDGNEITQCEAPDKIDGRKWKCLVVNKIDPNTPIEDYQIDYEYYLRKIKNIIEKLEKGKVNNKPINKLQLSMF